MRLLICGDRNWTNFTVIKRRLKAIMDFLPNEQVTVIHGGARGADILGGRAARELGLPVVVFPAEWDKYGKAAGPIRNQQMIEEGRPDFALVFHNNLAISRGTRDMINRLRSADISYDHFVDVLPN